MRGGVKVGVVQGKRNIVKKREVSILLREGISFFEFLAIRRKCKLSC